jgi:hypothetical protein
MNHKTYVIAALGVVALIALLWRVPLRGTKVATLRHDSSHAATETKAVEAYGELPLAFELNQGQSGEQVKFLARGSGFSLFLTEKSAVLALPAMQNSDVNGKNQKAKVDGQTPAGSPSPASLPQTSATDRPHTQPAMLRMGVVDTNPRATIKGLEELPGKSNYFIGNDPKKWRANVPNYAEVEYHDIYPGVNLIYYGNQGKLEYDFVVEPGADPSRILLDIGTEAGGSALHIANNGDLIISAESGQVVVQKPTVYQPTASDEPRTTARKVIDGKYVLVGAHRVAFQVAAYDHSKALVIDPTLVYSSYLGGNHWEKANGIAVDASGHVYLTGKTLSVDFPVTRGAFQTRIPGQAASAFITEVNSTGTALIYSTYLGGSNANEGYGIAVDSSGNAYVTGWTASANFPVTTGALQTTFGGGYDDAFVTKLNSTGSALLYSTYLGGSNFDEGHGIAVDTSGNAYVTGLSYSRNFPIVAGALQKVLNGCDDAFVSKLNATGTALIYSTYLGGNSYDVGNGIALDKSGNAYVTGFTYSQYFPTTQHAFQPTWSGGYDAFISKVNPSGTALTYSTYVGGSGDDYGQAIAVDATNSAYITGRTYSSNFPTTALAFQPQMGGLGTGFTDAFVVKLSPAGSALVYSTYLGGACDDAAYGIAVDASGNASVIGDTCSVNFPTTAGAFQTKFGGLADAFFSKLNPAGSALVYSTFLGGTNLDGGTAVALDSSSNAYLAGWTESSNFPTTAGTYQTILTGEQNVFLAEVSSQ